MLNNDREIKICAAGDRRATNWPVQTYTLEGLYNKLKTPARGAESLREYLALPKGKQDALKDVGGFVAGVLANGVRKSTAVESRELLTLDMDSIPAGGTESILRRLSGLGCGWAAYSTRKHCPAAPRLRVLLPLDRPASADEYEPIARKAAEIIGIAYCDPSTFQAARLMYWPSCCADVEYVFRYEDKPLLSADGMLGMYQDWRDVTQWPDVPGVEQRHTRLLKKQVDPTAKEGIVGAFCRTFDISGAMERFLPGEYEPADQQDRYTYTGGSTTGGAVIYENGLFLYSHHATDPCSGRLVNAFDLVRLHKFGEMDAEAKPDTPPNRLPSFHAMCGLASQEEGVATLLNTERYAFATQDFKEVLEAGEDDTDWMSKLDTTAKGAVNRTADNALLILEHDPLLKDRIGLDEFANRGVVFGTVPWDKRKEVRRWSDTDDAGARWYMEKVYDLTGKEKILDALSLCGRRHAFDEVKNYLAALHWDGIPRLDTLLVDYLGAPDTDYIRAVTRKSFTAAVARIMTPGVKYDTMTIITGPQGAGKSTLLAKMGRNWFTDGLKTFEGKEACEIIQGMWIVEIGELEAFKKSEVNRIKQFLSQRVDRYRAAYGRNVQDCPRRCVFFGTSNTHEYLEDRTGGRRFWPVDLTEKPTKSVFKDLDEEVNQVWAEAMVRWQAGEPLYLSGALEEVAKAMQEDHRERSSWEGLILDFLEKPVPRDWNSWELDRRRMYWGGGLLDNLELVERDKVCALEIWCEALNGEHQKLRRADAMEINSILAAAPGWIRIDKAARFGSYGVQKGFQRT